uniref:Uncharacterized protein n=1 Tax=Anguilla anguilla TaxID=7936 RepID=A0A0E9Q760_ANGAN
MRKTLHMQWSFSNQVGFRGCVCTTHPIMINDSFNRAGLPI